MVKENEQSSEDQKIAQEALDATNEDGTSPADESGKKEDSVPVAKHAALRHRAQEAEIAKARVEGELAAMKQIQPLVSDPFETEYTPQEFELAARSLGSIISTGSFITLCVIRDTDPAMIPNILSN